MGAMGREDRGADGLLRLDTFDLNLSDAELDWFAPHRKRRRGPRRPEPEAEAEDAAVREARETRQASLETLATLEDIQFDKEVACQNLLCESPWAVRLSPRQLGFRDLVFHQAVPNHPPQARGACPMCVQFHYLEQVPDNIEIMRKSLSV